MATKKSVPSYTLLLTNEILLRHGRTGEAQVPRADDAELRHVAEVVLEDDRAGMLGNHADIDRALVDVEAVGVEQSGLPFLRIHDLDQLGVGLLELLKH